MRTIQLFTIGLLALPGVGLAQSGNNGNNGNGMVHGHCETRDPGLHYWKMCVHTNTGDDCIEDWCTPGGEFSMAVRANDLSSATYTVWFGEGPSDLVETEPTISSDGNVLCTDMPLLEDTGTNFCQDPRDDHVSRFNSYYNKNSSNGGQPGENVVLNNGFKIACEAGPNGCPGGGDQDADQPIDQHDERLLD